MARLMEVMLAVRAGLTSVLWVPPEEAVVEGTNVEKAAGVTSATELLLVDLKCLDTVTGQKSESPLGRVP